LRRIDERLAALGAIDGLFIGNQNNVFFGKGLCIPEAMI
jgi:hypothetical protein